MAKSISSPISPVVNSFDAFADNMLVLSERFRNNVAVMAIKAGYVAIEAAAVRTPVDTSEARSNWSLDTIKTTVVRPPYASGRHLGINERGAFNTVVADARRMGRSISKEHVCRGGKIWISNPTPYIQDLNNGTSDQNREGNFDLIAVMQAKAFCESYVRQGKLLTIVDSP